MMGSPSATMTNQFDSISDDNDSAGFFDATNQSDNTEDNEEEDDESMGFFDVSNEESDTSFSDEYPGDNSLREDPYTEQKCLDMVASLDEQEKEHAARSSYRYFLSSVSCDNPKSDERDRHAVAMAKRHLIAEKGNKQAALQKLKSTIRYRQEIDVDGIRRCFYNIQGDHRANNVANTCYVEYRSRIQKQLQVRRIYAQGYDKTGKALYIISAHLGHITDPDWFILANVYTLERALACTERRTNGAEDKVIVLFDFTGFRRKDIPPLGVTKRLLRCLRDHFPERLQHVFLLDAPKAFRAFWVIIKPFVDPFTRKRVRFVKGEREKHRVIADLISQDQATPWMYSDGTKATKFSLIPYLYDVPFDQAFDDDAESSI